MRVWVVVVVVATHLAWLPRISTFFTDVIGSIQRSVSARVRFCIKAVNSNSLSSSF